MMMKSCIAKPGCWVVYRDDGGLIITQLHSKSHDAPVDP